MQMEWLMKDKTRRHSIDKWLIKRRLQRAKLQRSGSIINFFSWLVQYFSATKVVYFKSKLVVDYFYADHQPVWF